MTQDQFIDRIRDYSYLYTRNAKEITVKDGDGFGDVYLNSLNDVPDGLVFNNPGDVYLDKLVDIPGSITFKNSGDVDLTSLEKIGSNIIFENGGDVYLPSLKSVPSDYSFNNKGQVSLDSLGIYWISEWSGSIEDIKFKDLLNLMIKKGLLE